LTLRVRYEASRSVKHAAFKYQLDAVEAIKNLEYAALFHEQGLGKTKIAIDLALMWLDQNAVDSILILTKKSLVANWAEEFQAHSFLKPRILGQHRPSNYLALNSPARIYLAHYEVCRSEIERLKLFLRTRRVGVICDEAQKFKNPESSVAQALFDLGPGFVRRVIMTGTPVANRPFDIWALIRFLDNGAALGLDYEQFKSDFDLSEQLTHDDARRAEFENRLSTLMDRIRSFTIRETKASAGLELPGKEIREVVVDLEDRQEELYRNYREELRSVVVRGGKPVVDDVDNIIKRLLRLIQVASNPALVDSSYNRPPGKLAAVEEILDEVLRDPPVKAIVWSNFTANVDWLARELKRFGTARVHGKIAIDDRNRAIKRFKSDSECRVLVATPGAAKEGLTLTVANHAVFFDRGLSLDDYLQAQDRIHRISQTKNCIIYNLIARDTIDEWVDELLVAKHLAARLALSDINKEQYQELAKYEFAEVLQRILGSPSTAND